MALFYILTFGGGAVVSALGFCGIYLGRRRGRPRNDVGVLAAVLLVAGFVTILVGAWGLRATN